MIRKHCVVLGDVIDSRKIEDREAFQEKLNTAFSRVNKKHKESIYAPFTTLKGVDEIGGVLNTVSPIAEIQQTIARTIHPEQIRLAAVIGEIDVNVKSKDVSKMDGGAFARADVLLYEIEEEDLTFRLSGNNPLIDGFISDEINLLDIIRNEWTERKIEVISEYEKSKSQKKVANTLGITTQAVSNHLRESNLRQVMGIERRLIERLHSYPDIDSNATGHESN